ncbi:MAG TPA: response regulator transcription factor [Anaerolineales bacterium]|nr:response regulator transcription factor [Anaerolineales bacterium]
MSKKVRVTILEDHPGIIDGYRYRLGANSIIEITNVLTYGEQLEPTLKESPSDVLLLDINVPTSEDNQNPYPILHVIPKLLETYPTLHILVISMFAEKGIIGAVLESGVNGYILKDDQKAIPDLANIVLSIAKGDIYFSEKIEKIIDPKGPDGTLSLSRRQKEVLSLCAAYPDALTSELGKMMGIEHSTVRILLSTSYIKLGVRTRTAAVIKARQLGVITPYEPTFPR